MPAAVRWVSLEPLLGPVDLLGVDTIAAQSMGEKSLLWPGDMIDWAVVGGESGPGARPMHPDWPRSIRDQCQQAGVPFFFKQWGEWQDGSQVGKTNRVVLRDGRVLTMLESGEQKNRYFGDTAAVMAKVGKKAAGRELDGRTWEEYPE